MPPTKPEPDPAFGETLIFRSASGIDHVAIVTAVPGQKCSGQTPRPGTVHLGVFGASYQGEAHVGPGGTHGWRRFETDEEDTEE